MAQHTQMWDAARNYAKAGIYVYPVYVSRKPDGKKDVRPIGPWRKGSSVSLADIAAWAEDHPSAGLLIDCGKSGLVVVDCDGPEGIANWLALDPPAPLGIVTTAGGGEHWYYAAHPDHPIGNDQDGKVAPKVDVRGLGGLVIAPPTTDGVGAWTWRGIVTWDAGCIVPQVVIDRMKPRESAPSAASRSNPDDDLFDDPAKEFTRAQAKEWLKKASAKLEATQQGYNGAINEFAMGCAHFPWLVDRDACARQVIKVLGPRLGWTAPDSQDIATINSAYSATEEGRSWVAVEREAVASVAAAQAQDEAEEPEDRWTDAMLAGRLAREVLTGAAVYTTALGWLVWDGCRYAASPDEAMHETARRWVLREYAGAVQAYRNIPAPDHKLSEDPAVKGWAGAQGANRLASMVKLARGILLRSAGEFDADPDILNTPGGVLDLRTLELSPCDPARLVTKVTAVSYRPEARSEALTAALSAVPGDAQDWLQMRLGEAASGRSGEQLVLVTGSGRNGKTLLMGAAYRALGDYAAKVPNTLLLRARQSGGATPERMTLRGVRLAYMEETPEDGYLDSTVVKDLLDAEEIEGRHLYRDIVHWRPTHSLFLNTNHPPTMGDTGDGAWRRLTRIDFPYRFRKAGEELEHETDRVGDPGLKQALGGTVAGQEALLAWIVGGARRMYAAGSVEESGADPASVVASMRQWREESDDLLRFISAEMVFMPNGHVGRTDMYQAFAAWLRLGGHRALSLKTFGQRMESHSILRKRVASQRVMRSQEGLTRPAHLLHDGLLKPLSDRFWAYGGLAFVNDQGLDLEV